MLKYFTIVAMNVTSIILELKFLEHYRENNYISHLKINYNDRRICKLNTSSKDIFDNTRK